MTFPLALGAGTYTVKNCNCAHLSKVEEQKKLEVAKVEGQKNLEVMLKSEQTRSRS